MRHYSNTAVQTALLAGVTAADPSLTVVDANGYPATPFAVEVQFTTSDGNTWECYFNVAAQE